MRLIALFAASGIAALLTSPAYAGSSDTSDVACGSTTAGWSAPKGAMVASRGAGPVGAVINAIGEHYTHLMMSHGAGGYVTHSTMYSPGTNGWPTYCSTPVKADELEHGYPGASQVNQGAIYQFTGGNTGLKYSLAASGAQRTAAEQVADHAWYDVPYQWVASKQNSGAGLWLLGEQQVAACDYQWTGTSYANNCPTSWNNTDDGCDCGCQFSDGDCGGTFSRYEYSTYQYMNIQGRHNGGFVTNNGTQCSSFPAAMYNEDTNGAAYVAPYTYSHSQIVTAGANLYTAVENECDDGLGFWGGLGASITCFEGICDDAARQVRACFIDPSYCDTDSDTPWNNLVNNPSSTAWSISPDRLIGRGVHASALGAANRGPWVGNVENQVYWNAPGNVYGCWF